MIRWRALGLTIAVAACFGAAAGNAATHHPRHTHHGHHRAVSGGGAGYGARRPYASSVSPTITCYYADGTPYDPDVIGGPNHVGDGGPSANFGGFDPCAF